MNEKRGKVIIEKLLLWIYIKINTVNKKNVKSYETTAFTGEFDWVGKLIKHAELSL